MKLFRRIRLMVSAGVNDVLDKVENPSAMVNEMVRDMERAQDEVRENTIAVVAAAKATARRLEGMRKERADLDQSVEKAVQAGQDDAARVLLRRRKALDHMIGVLERESAEAEQLGGRMKGELKSLQVKLQEARVKREVLIAKQNAARTRQKLYDATSGYSSALQTAAMAGESAADISACFTRLEEKIEKEMATAEAREEMLKEEGVWDVLWTARDEALEGELRELKQKLQPAAQTK